MVWFRRPVRAPVQVVVIGAVGAETEAIALGVERAGAFDGTCAPSAAERITATAALAAPIALADADPLQDPQPARHGLRTLPVPEAMASSAPPAAALPGSPDPGVRL